MKSFIRISAAVILVITITTFALSQGSVGINNDNSAPHSSAMLDVKSTSLGFLPPRMTTTQRTGIGPPTAAGLMVYDTDTKSNWYYDGTGWVETSFGNLWSSAGTTVFPTLLNADVVVGTNTPAPGIKFYVYGAPAPNNIISRFDGKVEFHEHGQPGANRLAEIDWEGSARNGVLYLWDGSATNTVGIKSFGSSYFTGGNFGIGLSNPSTKLHVYDATYPAQIYLENPAQGDAAMAYIVTGQSFTTGIATLPTLSNFKISAGPSLTPPNNYLDPSTFIEIHSGVAAGIIDFNHQSRARAYQEDMDGSMIKQLIPPNTWTPINFNIKQPPPHGYDEHNEFTPAPAINAIVPPEQAFFIASQEGYYQVNARCEFDVEEYFEDDLGEAFPVQVNADSYVSIAIYSGMAPGTTIIYAQGNNLQIGYLNKYQITQYFSLPEPPYWEFFTEDVEEIMKLKNNNAPNVSDVVYLKAGEVISIWVFHTALTPMNLNYIDNTTGVPAGKSKIYVSIHKLS